MRARLQLRGGTSRYAVVDRVAQVGHVVRRHDGLAAERQHPDAALAADDGLRIRIEVGRSSCRTTSGISFALAAHRHDRPRRSRACAAGPRRGCDPWRAARLENTGSVSTSRPSLAASGCTVCTQRARIGGDDRLRRVAGEHSGQRAACGPTRRRQADARGRRRSTPCGCPPWRAGPAATMPVTGVQGGEAVDQRPSWRTSAGPAPRPAGATAGRRSRRSAELVRYGAGAHRPVVDGLRRPVDVVRRRWAAVGAATGAMPVSSITSRHAAASACSPGSSFPFGSDQSS